MAAVVDASGAALVRRNSPHTEGRRRFGESGMLRNLAGYSEHDKSYLLGWLEEDTEARDILESKAACDKLGDHCFGFTCKERGGQVLCTLRKTDDFGVSSSGEFSYLKQLGRFARRDEKKRVSTEERGAGYARRQGKALAGPISEDRVGRSVEDAQARCDELGDSCAGITCSAGADSCTVRASGTLSDSKSGETSYVKVTDCEWDDWGGWGACACALSMESLEMEPVEKRRRNATQEAHNGGRPCHGEKEENRTCTKKCSSS